MLGSRRLLMVLSSREEGRQEGVARYSRTPRQRWQGRLATLLDQVRRWRYESSGALSESSTKATPSLSGRPQLTEESRQMSRLNRERRRRRLFPPPGPRPVTTVSPPSGAVLPNGLPRRGGGDIENRNTGHRTFRLPTAASRPSIRLRLHLTTKRVAARFLQLLGGHAMIAPFLTERWGWIDSNICWWCRKNRQSREHLFKECTAWTKEIRDLWERPSGEETGLGIPLKAGRVSGSESGRQGQDPAIRRSGTCCRTTDTWRRY